MINAAIESIINSRKIESPVMNLAVNNPELCVAFLKHIFPERPYNDNPLDFLEGQSWPYGTDGKADPERKFRRFVQLCAQYYTGEDYGPHFRMELQLAEQMLKHVLKGFVHIEIQNTFMSMLWHAHVRDVELVAQSLMKTDELAKIASVDVIVHKNDEAPRGNLGRYVISLRNEKRSFGRLKFTNKNSMIYYLMFLIDRKQKEGKLTPLSLSSNKEAFIQLYKKVYDGILYEKIKERVAKLILRKSGEIFHAGRLNETIFDIRKHLEEAFLFFNESFCPYAMTADNHLTISADRIQFVGEAEKLVEEFNFET